MSAAMDKAARLHATFAKQIKEADQRNTKQIKEILKAPSTRRGRSLVAHIECNTRMITLGSSVGTQPAADVFQEAVCERRSFSTNDRRDHQEMKRTFDMCLLDPMSVAQNKVARLHAAFTRSNRSNKLRKQQLQEGGDHSWLTGTITLGSSVGWVPHEMFFICCMLFVREGPFQQTIEGQEYKIPRQ
uniref:TORC_N domain-containing protein n=1 Tax=Steinernema glaseri TaxID=37863 RepID=A0A1I8AHD1_9BILA